MSRPDAVADEQAELAGLIANIPDPEIPSLTIGDLGMVREVKISGGGDKARVLISPTYTGCPASEMIMQSVRETVRERGFEAEVEKALFPPWSTDWITTEGRRKLREAGIAPPGKRHTGEPADSPACCARCGSERTRRISQFGATPCKALYQCEACLEPFEYFKCF